MTIFPKIFSWTAVKICLKVGWLTSLNPASDVICTLWTVISVETGKNTHKIKKFCHNFNKFRIMGDTSGHPGLMPFFQASPENSGHLVTLQCLDMTSIVLTGALNFN